MRNKASNSKILGTGHRQLVMTGDLVTLCLSDLLISQGKSGHFNTRPYRIGRCGLTAQATEKEGIEDGYAEEI